MGNLSKSQVSKLLNIFPEVFRPNFIKLHYCLLKVRKQTSINISVTLFYIILCQYDVSNDFRLV